MGYYVTQNDLTQIADAIREKTGTADSLVFPNGFVSAVGAIKAGSGGSDVEAGIIDGTVTEINNNRATSVAPYKFMSCPNLTTVNLPQATSIGYSAFCSCKSLTAINFPKTNSIQPYAFYSCISLTEASFPQATTIDQNAFNGCQSLATISFPVATMIGGYAFRTCTGLTTAAFPAVTYIGSNAFNGCKNLTDISIPMASSVGSCAFAYCSSLTTITLPLVKIIGDSMFYGCRSLSTATLPVATRIDSSAFANSPNFASLYLASSKMVTLANYNAFSWTPMSSSSYLGKFGSIYVFAPLISAYKSATNWAYYADRFAEMFCVDSIQNDFLTLNQTKQISLNVYGRNENANVTCNVTSSNEDIIKISNLSVTNELITFNINTNQTTGTSKIRVELSCGDENYASEEIFTVFRNIPTCEVQAVEGATYGFELNNNGYYQNGNRYKQSSYAICKIVFNTQNEATLVLDCINYGEDNYDYGIISKVDTELGLHSGADSSTLVLKDFKTSHSSNIQSVEINCEDTNEHFIYIKYIKNYRNDYGTDTLQFKARLVPNT